MIDTRRYKKYIVKCVFTIIGTGRNWNDQQEEIVPRYANWTSKIFLKIIAVQVIQDENMEQNVSLKFTQFIIYK